ncbi:MAG: glycoside hydrolase [Candidatus Delongbacteria bacterium]|nr:glycoside hydrolase [Candidatus Delongbacteria bacterium]
MNPLSVVFLWHQHQPNYCDPVTDDFIMPWVRLHALKDYYDMAAYIEQVPGTRAVINLVPSLLEQLQAYIDGASDSWLDLSRRPVGDLVEDEQIFVLRHFLSIHTQPLLAHIPRYSQLQKLCALHPEPERPASTLQHFDTQKLRDVIVLFHLAWCGETLKRDPTVRRLIAQGGDFSEADKSELLNLQAEFLPRVLEIHRRLQREGRIELSTTPFYHPIMPLLINTDSGREMLPSAPFPEKKFSYPQDAQLQLRLAQDYFRQQFGLEKTGVWPAEGAISRDTCAVACAAGVPWLASDEEVLRNSHDLEQLEPRQQYRAHQFNCGRGSVSLFFRDRALSDLIGFTLANAPAPEAIARFMNRLNTIYDSLPEDKSQYIVPVILDGENAWENYTNNGKDFLTGLYQTLVKDPRYRLTTFSDYLAEGPQQLPLPHLRAGSWIYGTLSTWIGQEDKNRGWSYLSRTRLFYEEARKNGKLPEETLDQMQRRMLAAEGSDWFWWYGDDHYTDYPEEFDRLFRNNQQAVYLLAGKEIPDYLKEPVLRRSTARAVEPPVQVIHPLIDGRVTNYFEWISAGRITQRYAAIHRDQALVKSVRFGCDGEYFYLQVEFNSTPDCDLPEELIVALEFAGLEEEIRLDPHLEGAFYRQRQIGDCRMEQVLEASVELVQLEVPRDKVPFRVRVNCGEETLEVLPSYGDAEVDLDARRVQSENWFV